MQKRRLPGQEKRTDLRPRPDRAFERAMTTRGFAGRHIFGRTWLPDQMGCRNGCRLHPARGMPSSALHRRHKTAGRRPWLMHNWRTVHSSSSTPLTTPFARIMNFLESLLVFALQRCAGASLQGSAPLQPRRTRKALPGLFSHRHFSPHMLMSGSRMIMSFLRSTTSLSPTFFPSK
jgi:hypothetical protein